MTGESPESQKRFILDENGFLVEYDMWAKDHIETGSQRLPEQSRGRVGGTVEMPPATPPVDSAPPDQPQRKEEILPLPATHVLCDYCASRVAAKNLRQHTAGHEQHCVVCEQRVSPGGLDVHLKAAHDLKTKTVKPLRIKGKLREVAVYECLVCHGDVLFGEFRQHREWCSPRDVSQRKAILAQKKPEPPKVDAASTQNRKQARRDQRSNRERIKGPATYCPYCGEEVARSYYLGHIEEKHSVTCFLCPPEVELHNPLDVHLRLHHHVLLLGCKPEQYDPAVAIATPYFRCTRCKAVVPLPDLKRHLALCKLRKSGRSVS